MIKKLKTKNKLKYSELNRSTPEPTIEAPKQKKFKLTKPSVFHPWALKKASLRTVETSNLDLMIQDQELNIDNNPKSASEDSPFPEDV
jgi:hypothetical protein